MKARGAKMGNKVVLCGVLALFVVVLIASASAYGQKRVLVDLTHAERISIDGIVSPNLDTSNNGRILNWTDWANYIRGHGYVVDVLTEGPISTEKLAGYDVLIIAEPDVTTSGPAYFTTEENEAIKSFVESGGGLLLMGTQLVGGSSPGEFMEDYDTVYHYPEILNALLENLSVGMRFAEGMIDGDPYDVMVEDDILDRVGGPKGNIWIDTGDKTHPIWDNVTRFAYWHGCSIDVTDSSIDIVATGDDDTYTTVKNADYDPVVKPPGSYPVAIAATEYGSGKIVAYGDAGCWQGQTPFGPVFTDPNYHEQEIALNIMEYLTAKQPITFSKELVEGWNLISLPLTADDMTVSSVFSSVAGKYDAIYSYNATTHSWVALGADDTLENGVGYFIHMTESGTWTYQGSAYTDMDISLQQGLNMIGWLNCSKDISDALSSIEGDYWYVARWNATAQKFEIYVPDAPSMFNDFNTMERGEGYFISMKSAETLTESC